ncbi:hypothetical protein [Spirosoma sp. KNUC1025]|uniref:hypothetical protein n=1 Tax=Spirosoma sp. KNUC1025 TaxID=2894082 RepID=UPI003864A15D|nr:hypothetical protein LN737_18990 [Spirosoma sp. KNUC1025]
MKKRVAVALILGLLVTPLIFRAAFPDLYVRIWNTYPTTGAIVIVALDVLGMWIILFILILFLRLIRRLRRQV